MSKTCGQEEPRFNPQAQFTHGALNSVILYKYRQLGEITLRSNSAHSVCLPCCVAGELQAAGDWAPPGGSRAAREHRGHARCAHASPWKPMQALASAHKPVHVYPVRRHALGCFHAQNAPMQFCTPTLSPCTSAPLHSKQAQIFSPRMA